MDIFRICLIASKIIIVSVIFIIIGVEIISVIIEEVKRRKEIGDEEESEPDPAEFDEDGG